GRSVAKVHHCLVDGVSGAELLAVTLDLGPEPPPVGDDPWRPEPLPSPVRLARDAAVDLATSRPARCCAAPAGWSTPPARSCGGRWRCRASCGRRRPPASTGRSAPTAATPGRPCRWRTPRPCPAATAGRSTTPCWG